MVTLASNWPGDWGWRWLHDRFEALQTPCMHQSADPTDTDASLPWHIQSPTAYGQTGDVQVVALAFICVITCVPDQITSLCLQSIQHV